MDFTEKDMEKMFATISTGEDGTGPVDDPTQIVPEYNYRDVANTFFDYRLRQKEQGVEYYFREERCEKCGHTDIMHKLFPTKYEIADDGVGAEEISYTCPVCIVELGLVDLYEEWIGHVTAFFTDHPMFEYYQAKGITITDDDQSFWNVMNRYWIKQLGISEN